MKSSVKFAVYYIIAVVVFLANLGLFVKDQMYFSMDDLPPQQAGTLLYSSMCPDGVRSAEAYRIDTPAGSAVKVQIRTPGFATETGEDQVKNIYWQVNKSTVMMGWNSEDPDIITVDNVTLNLSLGETFDSRRIASFSQKWVKEG